MFKNKIYSIGLTLFLGVLALVACKEDYEFPDPGFEIQDQDIELRRDTIDIYRVEIEMNVPNGLNKIEVLDGHDYSLIDEVNEYGGQTKFLFEYDIDLTPFDNDTVLNYIIRAVDNDGRSINKGLKLTVKQKSTPEIQLVGGDNVALALPAYLAKALVTTGLAPMESIIIRYEGSEVKTITFPADTLVYEYKLKEQVIVGQLNENQEYKLEIEVSDKGIDYTTAGGDHITREALCYVKEITVTKGSGQQKIPSLIVYNSTYSYNPLRLFIYANGDSRIDSMVVQRYSSFNGDFNDPEAAIVFSYNAMDMVDTIRFGRYSVKKVFTYTEGTTLLEKVEEWPIDATPETVQSGDIEVEASNFTYNDQNQAVSYFYAPSSYMVNDLRYVDPFGIGDYVGIESFRGNLKISPEAADRDYYDSYAPVFAPAYIPGLPSTFKFEGGTTIGEMLNLLCYNPYLALELKDADGEISKEFSYNTDEDGFVNLVTWEQVSYGNPYTYSYTITY
ncbi:hypothetical protein [Mangrovibacterium lignilyticum]|uniref:hypothetical protein n=1 Tax=Mangrovibacterium lignilyticum TaxID=2668052 RepID=UPI0013D413DF|nr:hypothetical protein [Mangrovibacterium lignilyticum]